MTKVIKRIFAILLILGIFGSIANIFLSTTSVSTKNDEYDFSSVSIACIGDSITLATQVDKSYPTCLGEALGTNKVYNYGISWSTVATVAPCSCHPNGEYSHYPYVNRYDDIVSSDIIIVMGGINDYGCLVPLGNSDDTSSDTFYGALNTLIGGLKKTYPDSYIVYMTGFDYYGKGAHNTSGYYWADYNNAIRQTCIKYNIDCLDIYNKLPFDHSSYTIDGIHPTQEFIEDIWVPIVADYIRNNYK